MPFVDLKRIQAASSDLSRDINRRIVLNLVRTRQPLSRADLARATGLQRSTISLIVEDLIEEAWIVEGPTGRLPRGRRPTYLRLNDRRLVIGVDLRPTQTSLALANISGRFLSLELLDTPDDPEAGLARITERIRLIMSACAGRRIEGIGISLPGRAEAGRLVFAPNLKWPPIDLRAPLMASTGLNVELENAANACLLAAVSFGGMDSCRNLVVVTVSEGIGTGILINGQLAGGLHNMAGEFGHVPLDANGPRCGCGSRGCWEVFGSNRSAVRYFMEGRPNAAVPGFADLLSLAEHGDARAAGALRKMAHYLGRGMRMIVAGLAPERILVIGDLTRRWDLFGPVIEAEVAAQILPGGSAPQLVPVHEDGLARLRGTVALVLRDQFSDARRVPG
jgi:predicted NBD/HSP70 family sugar kinase